MGDLNDKPSALQLALRLEQIASKLLDRATALWDAADRTSDDLIRNQPPRSVYGELSDVHSLCKDIAVIAGELAASTGAQQQDFADLAQRFSCPLKDVCKECIGRGCAKCHWVCVRSGAGKRFSETGDGS